MKKAQLLSYISNEKLYQCVDEVVSAVKTAKKEKEDTLYDNVIDPFSALFDSAINKISLSQWLELEKSRQVQKTLQNYVGNFHQSIIGCVDGWEDLGIGQIVDLRNSRRKILAEIKNKYNTTKGNHKVAIYDDLLIKLNSSINGKEYIAYYVEIIRKTKNGYCKAFTPSDNKTHQRRSENSQIKVIDGESFYHLATSSRTALIDLYKVLPFVLSDISERKIENDDTYKMLFEKAYNTTP